MCIRDRDKQDKMVCYTTSKAENKAIIYSNHLLYNQQSYSYLNIEKHPLCYKKSKSIDFTNLKYKSKSIFLWWSAKGYKTVPVFEQ